MVYYINESMNMNQMFNDFDSSIASIVHEYEFAILNAKYNFICENGYEMPIDEAKDIGEGVFHKMIEFISRKMSELKTRVVNVFKSWKEKLSRKNNSKGASKIQEFIDHLSGSFDKHIKKLHNSNNANEAKSTADSFGKDAQSTTNKAYDVAIEGEVLTKEQVNREYDKKSGSDGKTYYVSKEHSKNYDYDFYDDFVSHVDSYFRKSK